MCDKGAPDIAETQLTEYITVLSALRTPPKNPL
jgi:hypothetical protein